MKNFTAPEIEVIKFAVADIITTSNELPLTPFSEENELTLVELG